MRAARPTASQHPRPTNVEDLCLTYAGKSASFTTRCISSVNGSRAPGSSCCWRSLGSSAFAALPSSASTDRRSATGRVRQLTNGCSSGDHRRWLLCGGDPGEASVKARPTAVNPTVETAALNPTFGAAGGQRHSCMTPRPGSRRAYQGVVPSSFWKSRISFFSFSRSRSRVS